MSIRCNKRPIDHWPHRLHVLGATQKRRAFHRLGGGTTWGYVRDNRPLPLASREPAERRGRGLTGGPKVSATNHVLTVREYSYYRIDMNATETVEALGALAHEHRFAIYRLLVEKGPEGLSAGDIAERIGLVPSSLTFHVQSLQRAGLIKIGRAHV